MIEFVNKITKPADKTPGIFIIFHAMKSKQNTDLTQIDLLKRQIDMLTDIYFDDHGKQYLKDLMNK